MYPMEGRTKSITFANKFGDNTRDSEMYMQSENISECSFINFFQNKKKVHLLNTILLPCTIGHSPQPTGCRLYPSTTNTVSYLTYHIAWLVFDESPQ